MTHKTFNWCDILKHTLQSWGKKMHSYIELCYTTNLWTRESWLPSSTLFKGKVHFPGKKNYNKCPYYCRKRCIYFYFFSRGASVDHGCSVRLLQTPPAFLPVPLYRMSYWQPEEVWMGNKGAHQCPHSWLRTTCSLPWWERLAILSFIDCYEWMTWLCERCSADFEMPQKVRGQHPLPVTGVGDWGGGTVVRSWRMLYIMS